MLNKKGLTLIGLIILLILPLVIAQVEVDVVNPFYPKGVPLTLSIPCTNTGVYCSPSAVCKTTIINPDSIVLFNDYTMPRNGAVFEVSLNSSDTDTNGEYQFNVVCTDTTGTASRFLKFSISPNGEAPEITKGVLAILLLALLFTVFLFMIVGGFNAQDLSLKGFLWYGGYVVFIGITFIAWNLSLDYLTSAPFIISFFRILFLVALGVFFPALILGVGYMVITIVRDKELNRLIDRGLPEEEAYERVSRRHKR